jgi:hypothetical protein
MSTPAPSQFRKIADVAAVSLSVRLYLEEIAFPTVAPAAQLGNCFPSPLAEVFGVQDYVDPTVASSLSGKACPASKLYRVLGVDRKVNCQSELFIVAVLPNLTADQTVCPDVPNVGYVQVPRNASISFVSMNWGDSLLKLFERPAKCGCETNAVGDALLYSRHIGSYDDSDQPAGWCGRPGQSRLRFKHLHHDITLNIYGPDLGTAQRCLRESSVAAALAAVISACSGVAAGAAVAAAEAAFTATFEGCAGNSFNVDFHDDSEWRDNC